MSEKTRNLSVYEYLKELQVEYIVFELRRKIYQSQKDRRYFEKVLNFKEIKIKDIARRNCLKSIFDDVSVREEYNLKVFRNGYPDFHYKTEEQRKEFEEKDLRFYYSVGSDVRFEQDGVQYVGKVKNFDLDKKILHVSVYNDIWEFLEDEYQTVVRVL